jgi:hypothetical protein
MFSSETLNFLNEKKMYLYEGKMVQECFDLWKTDSELTKLGKLISFATKAFYELMWSYSYACSFGSLTDADQQVVYRAAKDVIARLRGASFGVGGPSITFEASMDDEVARALMDTLCSYTGKLDGGNVCLTVQSYSKSAISEKEIAAVREVLSMIRASHELMSTLGPFAFCPMPSGQKLIDFLGVYFPSEQWLFSQMGGKQDCTPLVKSATRQWMLNVREAGVRHMGDTNEFRLATGWLMLLVQDSKVAPKIDGLFDLVADIVCGTKSHFQFSPKLDGAQQDDPASVRRFMLNAIAGIFLDACAQMPPEMRQNSDPFPAHAMHALVTPAPVQTRRSVPGSLFP